MANFFGDMYDNVLVGGPDDDVLWGGMGDDELFGHGGDDRLIGGPGADALDGGPGMDTASYTESTRGVRIDLGTSFASGGDDAPVRGGDAEGDSLTSIESIWGSNFADLLLGSHAANYLFGNGGNDRIRGGSGNDFIRGGDDDDVLGVDEGSEDGSSEQGHDTIYGDAGFDFLGGGLGNDWLSGGTGDDTLMGGAGDDVLDGCEGADELSGGAGMDIASYALSDAAVTVNLSNAGSATMKVAAGGHAEGDVFAMALDAEGMPTGLLDIEGIRGSMYDDLLTGDDRGAPVPAVLGDDPSTTGTTETDFVVEAAKPASASNTIYGNQGDDRIKGLAGNDTLYGGKGNDTLYGGADHDTLMGELGDDALKGEAGNDTLVGGPGADVLLGGTLSEAGMFTDDAESSDTADYSASDAGVRIDLSKVPRGQEAGKAGSIGEGGHAEGDVLHGIENLTGTAYADLLEGDDARNILMGGAGDDWDDAMTTPLVEGGLFGNDGNDVLSGGDGNDWLSGGDHHDDIWGGDGDDMLLGGAHDDRPFVTVDDNADGVHTTVDLSTTEFDFTKMVDGLNTRAGLFGGKGNDTLDGGAGNDYLDGGEGDDVFIYDAADMNRDGGPGSDTLDASAATDGLTLDLSLVENDTTEDADVQLKDIENLIGGSGNDLLTGTSAANILKGGPGNEWDNITTNAIEGGLYGGAGNDTFEGGEGYDWFRGGPGADVFVFGPGHDPTPGAYTSQGTGASRRVREDRILDFSPREGDKIDLREFNLSEDDLVQLLKISNLDANDAGIGVFTLNLGVPVELPGNVDIVGMNLGGGQIVVVMAERFQALDVDDFII